MALQALTMTPQFNLYTTPAGIPDVSHLALDSTLADLPTHDFQVDLLASGQTIAHQLEANPELPGVIVIDKSVVVGVFSRRKFLEQVGRPYGIELYLNRPIQTLVDTIQVHPLLLSSKLGIQTAAQTALGRPIHSFYEPVVVDFGNGRYRLLDTYILLLAQSSLLSLVHEIEQNRRQLAESFQKIGKALSSSLSLRKVTRRILKELDKVVPYERGTVMLRQQTTLKSVYHRGFPQNTAHEHIRVEIRDDEGDVFQRIIRQKTPIFIADVTQDAGWQQLDWLPVHKSWLGVPLIVQERVIGLLSLTRIPANAFSDDDINLVQTFAGQAATALENAQLYEQVQQFNNQLESMVEERTAELNRAYQTLEKLDQSKTDFIEVSAHELRTPLTIIKGHTQILGMHQAITQDNNAQTSITGILSGVERLHRVVNSMLDVAKIDSNALKVFQEAVDVHQIMAEITTSFRADLQARQLSLSVDMLDSLPTIQGDRELLRKVFYAVVVNAIKYTPDGGKITITGTAVTHDNAPHIQIIISDTGIGINPEQQDLIFEKFYQTGQSALHSSGETKFKGGGPGLGLAIARGIVQAHGGQIWVQSTGYDEALCPGSHFYIRLPLLMAAPFK